MRVTDKYLNPFTDFGFKKLFGIEPNKDLLIDFLDELLRQDEGTIQDLTYLAPEQLGRTSGDRKAIFDIYCENARGEKFIVEMQKAKQNYFKDRSLYYSTFPIQSQARKGGWDFELKSVYTVGLLDFVFAEDRGDDRVFHHEVQLFDKSTQTVFYEKLTYIYLEMPKFTKTLDELETHFDSWLYVLKHLEHLTDRPAKLQARVFKKLFEQAEIANFDEEEYSEYEASLKTYRDLKNSIDTAREEGEEKGRREGEEKGRREGEEKGRKEGKEEGRKEGEEKGREEGRKEGKEEGRKEGKEEGKREEKIMIAEKMKRQNIPPEIIAQSTGLPIAEIESL